MGLGCWLNGHQWERTELWTGNAYDIVNVDVEMFKCARCGKTKRTVHIAGKLSKKVAEEIVDNSAGVVNLKEDTPEEVELTATVVKKEAKVCKKKAA